MDCTYTASYLRQILNFVLVNCYKENELLELLKTLINQPNYDNYECNYIILVILNLLEKNQNTPVVNLFIQELKLKLIFNCYDKISDCTCNEKDCSCQNEEIELTDEDYRDSEKMAIYFWEHYSKHPFHPGPEDAYRLPDAEGKTMDLGVRDNTLYNGKEYFMRFKVNHKGEILEWIQKPQLRRSYDDFNAIYQGLLGEIMEYQKLKENV